MNRSHSAHASYGATRLLKSIAGAPCIEMHTKRAATKTTGGKMIAALANLYRLAGNECVEGRTRLVSRLDMIHLPLIQFAFFSCANSGAGVPVCAGLSRDWRANIFLIGMPEVCAETTKPCARSYPALRCERAPQVAVELLMALNLQKTALNSAPTAPAIAAQLVRNVSARKSLACSMARWISAGSRSTVGYGDFVIAFTPLGVAAGLARNQLTTKSSPNA